MLALEIDRLNEIDDSIKDQLKQAGFNSIKDIVIRGPVQVAKSAEIEIEEASSICNKASLLLEQLAVIPNNISEASNNSLTLNKEYIKTGSSDLDNLFGGKGIETGSVTEFYGCSGSGKTQICQTLCVTVQQLCSDNKAMFIDTEGKFRPERIAQIALARNLDSTKICMKIKYVRTDLLSGVLQDTYDRMAAERLAEAAKLRAIGESQSIKIRAEADRALVELVSKASRESEIIRGRGDAERNRVFADAFVRDPEFFSFYRSMQAYAKSLRGANTTLVLDPNSEFFKYFSRATPVESQSPPSGR